MPPIKTLTKDDFTFEVSETLCGTLAYVFYLKDKQIVRNNNYFPSKTAKVDDDAMFKELAKIIVKEKVVDKPSEVEKKFLESEDFIRLKNIANI